jgi:hypothetical protein
VEESEKTTNVLDGPLDRKDAISRLAEAFERIAVALEGLDGTGRTAVTKLWPEPAGQREVIVSKVETEDERVAREQGKAIPKSGLNEWLAEDFGGEDELVGEREREFLQHQREKLDAKLSASSQGTKVSGPAEGSSEETSGEGGGLGEGTQDNQPTQEG